MSSAADNEPREKKSRPSDSAALRQKKEDLLRGVLNSASDDVKRRFIEAYGLHRHEQQLRGEIASTPEKNTRGKDALTLEALVRRLREREVLPSFNDEITALAQARQLIDTKEVDAGALNALSASGQELRIQRKAKIREESKDATAKEEAKEEIERKGEEEAGEKGGIECEAHSGQRPGRHHRPPQSHRVLFAIRPQVCIPLFASHSLHQVADHSIPTQYPIQASDRFETNAGDDLRTRLPSGTRIRHWWII